MIVIKNRIGIVPIPNRYIIPAASAAEPAVVAMAKATYTNPRGSSPFNAPAVSINIGWGLVRNFLSCRLTQFVQGGEKPLFGRKDKRPRINKSKPAAI